MPSSNYRVEPRPARAVLPRGTPSAGHARSNILVMLCAALGLLFLWPWQHPIPAAAVGVFVFALVQIVFPDCRPVRNPPLCPWNWALLVFAIKLIILPVSEIVAGVQIGELPRLPSDLSINGALLLDTLAFLACAVAYDLCHDRLRRRRSRRATLIAWHPPAWLIGFYLLLGLAGVWLFFGDVDRLRSYFREPAAYFQLQQQQRVAGDRLVATASIFLRPFLGFSFVLLLCRALDARSRRPGFRLWGLVSALVLLVALAFSVFDYNRGAFIAPLLAISSVLLVRAGRRGWKMVASVALVGVAFLSLITVYRSTHGLTDPGSGARQWYSAGADLEVLSLVQIYGNGPQFFGFLLQETAGSDLQLGRGLLAAVMSPVPVLGKPFRNCTGTALYNRLLNRGDAEDQVISFAGEMFLNFHVIGIAAGFAFLGMLLAKLQDVFSRSRTALPLYVVQLTSIWLLFLVVGSLSVVTQIALYFYWPLYLYLILRRLSSRKTAPLGVALPRPLAAH
jgi:hypothetical protein